MNQYHIYEAIGRGNHSIVYKGRKKKTIEYYAIKSVEKTQKSQVLQEVRVLHSLDHRNVLKFYAWYETSAHLWLVLEYCVGGDLLTLLRQDKRLPEESIHDFARDLLQALQFLHSKGVIYCDLKPSNVLLDENGRLKLCDFGLARRLSDISKGSIHQLPQAKRGTPCYMAPELFEEGGVHSFASDLWALGCVMYECFAGNPPFVSSSFTQLVKSILSDPVPLLDGHHSKEFGDLVSHLLIKDPTQRIQWPELREHPFWRTELKALCLPSQPAFMNYIQLSQKKTRGADCSGVVGKPASQNISNGHKMSTDQSASCFSGRPAVRKGDKHSGERKGSVHARDTSTSENIPSSQLGCCRRIPTSTDVTPLKERSQQTNGAVNLLRLSRIVKTNLQRETGGENYRQAPPNTPSDADVTIENNDLELNFSEQVEDDAHDQEELTGPPASELHEEKLSQCALQKESWKHDSTRESPKIIGSDQQGNGVSAEIRDTKLGVTATPGIGLPCKAQSVADTKKDPPVSVPQASGGTGKASLLLSQALWHPSDLAVRPIILNRRIEKVSPSIYEARTLPVDCLTSAEFVKLPREQLDIFMNKVIASVGGNTAVSEKLNTLKYVECLCSSVEVSNLIINGPVMNMLVKMLRTSKPPALRFQIIHVMGLLIRHATLIEEELASSGILAVLTEGLREKQDKVRRAAMATLGELLFYIATQSDSSPRSVTANESPVKDGRSSLAWQVPNTLIALIASILRKGEDGIAQHYALKTIENIASQGGEWTTRFTNHGVLENLCYIFKASAKQENVRSTAGSCLVRLIRFNPSNIPVVLERLPFKDLVAGLAKGSSREQQVSLNLLNMALLGITCADNMNKYLLALIEEKTIVPNLVNLLEQGTEVVRGKAIVCTALLCKINRRWLPSFCNAKLLSSVERLTKEKDPYIQQCVEALVETVVGIVPGILDSISIDIQHQPTGKRTSSLTNHGTPHAGRSHIKSSLPLFPVVLYLFNNPIFRQKIVSEQILLQLAGFMNQLKTSFQGHDEFLLTLLRIIEIVGQQSCGPLQFQGIFLSQFLPSLAVLYRKISGGDMRFLCLKIFFDILVVFLDDISDFSSTEKEGFRNNIQAARMAELSHIARQHFLPSYTSLIEDEDPIPMYAQKLLVMLLDIKCIGITDIIHLKLLSQFFDFLWEDLSSINLYSVRLCLFLASAVEVETKALSELRVVGRIGELLNFVHTRGMGDFLDPVLSLCRSFLMRSPRKNSSAYPEVESKAEKSGGIPDIQEFCRYISMFMGLCTDQESHISETAAECLVLLVKAAPRETACMIISHLPVFTNVLENFMDSHIPAVSQMQRKLLFVLFTVCKEQRMALADSQPLPLPDSAVKDIELRIESVVFRLRRSNLLAVPDAVSDLALDLQPLPFGTSC